MAPKRQESRIATSELFTLHQTVSNLIALETQAYWQINTALLLGLTLLAGFLSKPAATPSEGLHAIVASVLGIALGVVWFRCISRSNAWHQFRVDQAIEIERDPKFTCKPATEATKFRSTAGSSIRQMMHVLAVAFTIGFALAFLAAFKIICRNA